MSADLGDTANSVVKVTDALEYCYRQMALGVERITQDRRKPKGATELGSRQLLLKHHRCYADVDRNGAVEIPFSYSVLLAAVQTRWS